MRLLRTSHLGPTLVVTLISFLLAHSLWPMKESLLIGLAIFTGQLCVGWTNDLLDAEIDRVQGRKNKPIAQGQLAERTVITSTFISLLLCIELSLLGPLGLRGGLVHLLGVGCGVAYNFFFKGNLLSPLPYAIAFAGLPTAIALSKGHFPPAWLALAGGILGIAAHFTNVVKDMDADRIAGILGLPQMLGARNSQLIGGVGFVIVAAIIQFATGARFIFALGLVFFALIFFIPKKFAFLLSMALAVLDVFILVRYGSRAFSQRS